MVVKIVKMCTIMRSLTYQPVTTVPFNLNISNILRFRITKQ